MKGFNAQDGQGLPSHIRLAFKPVFITGRSSPAVAKRAEELKVDSVCLGRRRRPRLSTSACDEVSYMGDDLPDIPLARRAGLSVCVADGAPELKAVCHFTTRRLAGHGAAREVVELILKAQGRWEDAVPRALA
jgi:3-deoxy-D-manno-octulosonate 8-phosphate phosphatase (KDO 8-P phosphatase)